MIWHLIHACSPQDERAPMNFYVALSLLAVLNVIGAVAYLSDKQGKEQGKPLFVVQMISLAGVVAYLIFTRK